MGRRTLMPALAAEGPSDDPFLAGLLDRLLEDLCWSEFEDTVDIQTPFTIRPEPHPMTIDQTIGWVREHGPGYNLVFFHRDQGSNAAKVRRDWIEPLRTRWRSLNAPPLVCVVPVVETESWCLADGDALRSVLGVTWNDAELGIPRRPAEIEKIADPKAVLKKISDRLGRRLVDYFETLGRQTSLDALGRLPSFQRLRAEVKDALIDLGFRERR